MAQYASQLSPPHKARSIPRLLVAWSLFGLHQWAPNGVICDCDGLTVLLPKVHLGFNCGFVGVILAWRCTMVTQTDATTTAGGFKSSNASPGGRHNLRIVLGLKAGKERGTVTRTHPTNPRLKGATCWFCMDYD
ncbi:hypothetical protein ACE6H2_021689 [Prunus campanulata]